MSIHARSTHYRGYDIVAAGQACDICQAGTAVEHFVHDYHCRDLSPQRMLAMLLGEARERVDRRLGERRHA